MSAVRKSLYERLPEIYRIKDTEQIPPGQLEAYLGILDAVQQGLYDNIESLYHDLFIETCHDWVVPYLADLLGSSHLSGDPWTLRADVARTIRHRRRKGTLGAIESLSYALSRWAVHTVEFRELAAWNQQLNHQRPDRNGAPPQPLLITENRGISGAVTGGTANLRDPALLSLTSGAFDPFARVVDVKPMVTGASRVNVPNLGIFIWRLGVYTLPSIRPALALNERFEPLPEPLPAGDAEFVVGFDVHPLGQPMVLFNTHRYDESAEPLDLTHRDAVPGPMPMARLSDDTPTGNPDDYVSLVVYSDLEDLPDAEGDESVGLTLYLPEALNLVDSEGQSLWKFRGANLCAWQHGLNPALRAYEIAVDPMHGRLLFGVTDPTGEADVVADGLYASPTYGFAGPTGAHPVVRGAVTGGDMIRVSYSSLVDETGTSHAIADGSGVQEALNDIHLRTSPLLIQIEDSRIYDLNLASVTGIDTELGLNVLRLNAPLHIRAASGQRPVIRLSRPFACRPQDVSDPSVAELDVTLEGLYLTWDHGSAAFAATTPLIARAAVNRLLIDGCTLDPGCHESLDGLRQPVRYALSLDNAYGFDPAGGEDFDQVPRLVLRHSICGPIAMDDGYELSLEHSIVDAASGRGDDSPALAVHAASGDAETAWGPALSLQGMTCFGRMRVESATGQGGIWVHGLQVHDDQIGCIKHSYFAASGNRLPQFQACVFGDAVMLSFVSEVFGNAAYAQLHLRSDRKILEQGPNNDAMGAFGYLLNSHKWKNIGIRYREFMPVGIRPVLVPVT